MRYVVGCLVLSFVILSISYAGEKVENPEYAAWAKLKVGSMVIYEETLPFGDKKIVQFRHHTLTEIKDKEIRVESRCFVEKGDEIKDYKTNYPIWKGFETTGKEKKGDPVGFYADWVYSGKEKVKLNGKEYNTQVFKLTKTFPTETFHTYWITDELPTRLLKSEETEKSGGKMKVTRTITFKEFKPAK